MANAQNSQPGRRKRYGSREDVAAEFTGRVNTVGPEPSFVTGEAMAIQSLNMLVTDSRRGELQVGSEVDVDVAILAGMPHIALGASGLPALDPQMVVPTVLVVVWANPSDGRWLAQEISTDGPSSPPVA